MVIIKIFFGKLCQLNYNLYFLKIIVNEQCKTLWIKGNQWMIKNHIFHTNKKKTKIEKK